MSSSTGKKILITGASTGIGAATAEYLAEGNELVIHFNASGKEAETVAEKVRARGGIPHLVQADLGREDGCRTLADFVETNLKQLDVLVNNAGSLVERQSVRELEWELMERVFSLNVFSLMKLSSLLVPMLEKRSGACVVNVTSIAMRHGAPTATIYGAAKAAVDSFTRGMAREVAPAIRVNAVAPGVIETPFHERFSSPEKLKEVRETTPLKRNGDPVCIARTIAFLIDNDFITGETVDVNGGLFMR